MPETPVEVRMAEGSLQAIEEGKPLYDAGYIKLVAATDDGYLALVTNAALWCRIVDALRIAAEHSELFGDTFRTLDQALCDVIGLSPAEPAE